MREQEFSGKYGARGRAVKRWRAAADIVKELGPDEYEALEKQRKDNGDR